MGALSWTEDYGEEVFQGFNMAKLRRDEAYINVTSENPVYLYSLYKECVECPFIKEHFIDNNLLLTINTNHAKMWRVLTEEESTSPVESNHSVLCELDSDFGEFGVYDLQISKKDCVVNVLKEPVNIYFPILTVLLIYALAIIVVSSSIYVWKVYTNKTERMTTSFERSTAENNQQKKRLQSLDTFRGISIVLMIFVNYGCGGYAAIEHAIWNGLQLSDVVFPWFMWIMGVCIPMSVSSIMKKGTPKKVALQNVLRRSCILFALGLFLGAGPYLNRLRIFGVLQRFGLCYLVAAAAFVLFSTEGQFQADNLFQKKSLRIWQDVLAIKYQWMVATVLLVVHNLLTFMLTVPNCPTGYLGPGGYHDDGKYFKCTGGAAGYIDKVILGNHRYRYPTIVEIYKSEPFDPEGILGCLTSVIQVIIGAQAGATILIYKEHAARIKRWLSWGVLLSFIGACLCGFSRDNGPIPINKNLWSLSFVMVTSGLAFLLLSLCYYLIDVQEYWSGKPFLFAGMNAIFMYVGHSLTYSNFPIRWVPQHSVGMNTHFLTLLENVWATGAWVVIAYYLFRIKFFLSI